ncbi:MAG: 50S ribosomal protein L4 [Dehalococcoidia bacterium]|nr:50S ribosomal protein L4 [Dehalococcoidia bacterium]
MKVGSDSQTIVRPRSPVELQVKNNKGEVVHSIQASDAVWGADPNNAVLHQAVVAQQANRRQGTHSTLRRMDVEYSTVKLRAQKHTGRARLGSRGSPSMGGSVAHGPHPRSYRQDLPKKMRRLALRVALSDKLRENSIIVLDGLKMDKPQTKQVTEIIKGLGLKGTTLIITSATDQIVIKSASNVPDVEVLAAPLLNPLQAVKARNLVITEDAVRVVDSIWGEKS